MIVFLQFHTKESKPGVEQSEERNPSHEML